MNNLAYNYQFDDEPDYEIIEGEINYMAAAAPNISHGIIVSRLNTIFNVYIDEKNLKAFVLADNADVYLSEENHFRPDVSVIVRKPYAINREKYIDGAPDLIVEVLSESTMKNDTGIKKDAYEKHGVKEYWIVDPNSRSIQVYHNIEGKFKRNGEYNVDNNKIKVSIFEDLVVDVRSVFKWWLD